MTDHRALTRSMFESMTAGSDIDQLVETYMAEDFIEHETVPGMGNTRDTPRQLFKMLLAAFPDFRAVIHDVLQDGDKVVVRASFTGTQQGEFMGIPASGNRVEWSVIDILEFRDDKVIAHWGVMDMAAAMAQMGAGHG